MLCLKTSLEIPQVRFNQFLIKDGELISKMRSLLLDKEQEILKLNHTPIAGVYKSSITTWKQYNVLSFPGPEFKKLAGYLQDAFYQYCSQHGLNFKEPYIQSWINIMRNGDKILMHHHDDNGLSGLLYLSEYSRGEGGETIYYPDKSNFVKIFPEAGSLNLFHPLLPHSVSTYKGQVPRVTLAFDISDFPREGHSYIKLY